MVGADVEKDGGGKVGAQCAVVLQRLAGGLHHQVLHARPDRVGQMALELQGLRGGDVGLKPLHPVIGEDGGQQAAARPAPLRLVLVQDVLEVEGGGGFSLCPRQGDHLYSPRGVVIEQVGQGGDGQPHVRHLYAGQAGRRVGRLAHIGDGPPVSGHG